LCLAVAALVAAAATPRAAGPASRKDAQQLKQKVATIQSHADQGAKQPRRTTVTESELNSYLVYDAKDQLPVGVVDPSLTWTPCASRRTRPACSIR
jgi:hypothetical protein